MGIGESKECQESSDEEYEYEEDESSGEEILKPTPIDTYKGIKENPLDQSQSFYQEESLFSPMVFSTDAPHRIGNRVFVSSTNLPNFAVLENYGKLPVLVLKELMLFLIPSDLAALMNTWSTNFFWKSYYQNYYECKDLGDEYPSLPNQNTQNLTPEEKIELKDVFERHLFLHNLRKCKKKQQKQEQEQIPPETNIINWKKQFFKRYAEEEFADNVYRNMFRIRDINPVHEMFCLRAEDGIQLAIIGCRGTGKRSLCRRVIYNRFDFSVKESPSLRNILYNNIHDRNRGRIRRIRRSRRGAESEGGSQRRFEEIEIMEEEEEPLEEGVEEEIGIISTFGRMTYESEEEEENEGEEEEEEERERDDDFFFGSEVDRLRKEFSDSAEDDDDDFYNEEKEEEGEEDSSDFDENETIPDYIRSGFETVKLPEEEEENVKNEEEEVIFQRKKKKNKKKKRKKGEEWNRRNPDPYLKRVLEIEDRDFKPEDENLSEDNYNIFNLVINVVDDDSRSRRNVYKEVITNANGYLICFSLDDKRSFKMVKKRYLKDVLDYSKDLKNLVYGKHRKNVVLVGLKSDVKYQERKVSQREVFALVKKYKLKGYVEATPRNGCNCFLPFGIVMDKYLNQVSQFNMTTGGGARAMKNLEAIGMGAVGLAKGAIFAASLLFGGSAKK